MSTLIEQYLGELILAYLGSILAPAIALSYREYVEYGNVLKICNHLSKWLELLDCDAKIELSMLRKLNSIICLDCNLIKDNRSRFGRMVIILISFSGYVFLVGLASGSPGAFLIFFGASMLMGYLPLLTPLRPIEYASLLGQAEAELEFLKNMCKNTMTGHSNPRT